VFFNSATLHAYHKALNIRVKGREFKGVKNMVYGYIYKIENLVNGKIYIGQTSLNPSRRRKNHLNGLKKNIHYNNHLQRAFNKYGECNFKFTVLNYATDKKTLDQLEKDYINYYHCLDPHFGYNHKCGGSNGKHTLETCNKISKTKKGVKLSLETRKKMSENHANFRGKNHPFYNKTRSLETREKISNSLKKYYSVNKHPFKDSNFPNRYDNRRGKSLFGFTGVKCEKNVNPENKPWRSRIKYKGNSKHLGFFHDPLSAQLVRDLVAEALINY